MVNSSSVATQETIWPINVDSVIMEIPRVIIEEIRAHPTHTSVGLPTPDKSSLGKDDQSLVEVPFRHLGPGRSEEIGLEHHSLSINDFYIVRSDTEGELVREENVGKPSHCNGIHGQPTCYKATASLPTHHGVQYSLDSY